MVTWGVTAFNHDTSIAVFEGNDFKFYEHVRGKDVDKDLVKRAIRSTDQGPSRIAWFERPWLKKTRQAYAGQWDAVRDMSVLPSAWAKQCNVGYAKIVTYPHHKSHAAAGYLTSPFDEATVVVLDAIGEWDTATIWHAKGMEIKKVWATKYPNSLGLFYSAFTKLLGFTPIKEEYKLQQLAEKGDYSKYYKQVKEYFSFPLTLRTSLHRGVWDWPLPVEEHEKADIAAAVQQVFEEQVDWIMTRAFAETRCGNLVYVGGCAMNSKYNKKLYMMWKNVWSIENPGDPMSAIGAALLDRNTRITLDSEKVKHLEIKTLA
jgi:carbamoyltransferase